MLSVGHRITDHALKESLEYTAGFFVDHYMSKQYQHQIPDYKELEPEGGAVGWEGGWERHHLLAEIRLTPPRRARRRIAGFVIPWMLSRRILRCRFAPPFPRPFPPFPPVEEDC